MPRQIPLDLPVIASTGREAFFVSPANQAATRLLDDWPRWPEARLLLTGPEGAGKSHLGAIWAGEAAAATLPASALLSLTPGAAPESVRPNAPLLLEDIHTLPGDPAAEEALFHLLNRFAAARAPLLMTAREPLAPPRLPDLATRLGATARVRLGAPDDALLTALLVKHFTDRQLSPAPELLDYLLTRMERSAAAAAALVAALDRHQLATGRRLSRALAAEVLDLPEFSGT